MIRPTAEQVEREIAALDALDLPALRARWKALYRREAPAKIRGRLLRLGIAYKMQELAFGGLKPQAVRLLRKLAMEFREERRERSSATSQPTETSRSAPTPMLLSPGTQLMRSWNGVIEIVTVATDGYLWGDVTYRTLSAVALAITGTKWSGPRFFGLNEPLRTQRGADGKSEHTHVGA